MSAKTLYVRTLKKVDFSVFAVSDGQKNYYDPVFNRFVPFSSGQQVKRSIIDAMAARLGTMPAPTTFVFDVNKNGEIGEGEVFASCDPSYPDQLVGGWMKAGKGGGERTLKRRSPLSISAMRALHPHLATVVKENVTFDRSDRPNSKVIVRGPNGSPLSKEEIVKLLEGKDRSLFRKWIPDQSRATGLFIQDVAIDLERLFCVSLNRYEPEITEDTEAKLREEGWEEVENRYYGRCLQAPASMREKIADALARAITDWRITSNQSRTFDVMTTLAIAISDNAQLVGNAIRAKLVEDSDDKVIPVIDEGLAGVAFFVTPAAGAYAHVANESANAIEEAANYLKNQLLDAFVA